MIVAKIAAIKDESYFLTFLQSILKFSLKCYIYLDNGCNSFGSSQTCSQHTFRGNNQLMPIVYNYCCHPGNLKKKKKELQTQAVQISIYWIFVTPDLFRKNLFELKKRPFLPCSPPPSVSSPPVSSRRKKLLHYNCPGITHFEILILRFERELVTW